MSYKADKPFSFGRNSYVKGQEVNIEDEDQIKKLVDRKLISSGDGKSAEDVEQERSDKLKAQGEKNRKKADEAEEKEKERLWENGRNVPKKFRTVDQTQSTATVPEKEKSELTDTGKPAA